MITIALSIHAFSGSMGQIGQLSWFQNSPPEEDSSQPAAPPANDRLFRQRPFGFNTNSLLLYHCNSPQPSSIFSLTFKCRPSHPVSFEPSVHLAGVRTDAVIGFLNFLTIAAGKDESPGQSGRFKPLLKFLRQMRPILAPA